MGLSNNQPVNGQLSSVVRMGEEGSDPPPPGQKNVMNIKIRAKSYCTEQVFGFLDVWGQSLDVSVLQYVLKKMQLYISFLLF